MTAKEKLYYLLEHHYAGEYTERDFADQFDFIFYRELNTDETPLTQEEYSLFRELAEKSSRYSPYKEDFKLCPGFFSDDDTIRKEALFVYKKLCTNKKSPERLLKRIFKGKMWT